MRVADYTNAAVSLASSYNSPAFTLDHMEGYSIQFSTGSDSTAVGTVKLQASLNANIDNVGLAAAYPDPAAVWVDVPGSTNTISSGSNAVLYNTTGAYYRWVRLVYTSSSGTGTALLVQHSKGAQS